MTDFFCPNSLLELQTWFAKIITSPLQEMDEADLPIYPSSLIAEIRLQIAPSPQLKSEERIGIYQQQYWWRLITIMQELYPSLVRIFDYEDFNLQIAEPYLSNCPPHDWFLSNIGLDLPEWLKKNYRKKNSSLVLPLAHLDHAYERLIFTALLPKIEPDAIQRCETEILYLQPYVMLFEFGIDFFTLRTKLLEHPPAHWQTHELPQMREDLKKRFFVLFRKNEQNFYEEISQPRFALLRRFQKGAKLTDLIPLLAKCDEIVEWFQTIASRGWLTFFKTL